MEDNQNRRPRKKRKENPIIEWISDNLRYIMLIGGIAIIILIIALIVRGVTSSGSKADNTKTTSSSGKTEDEEEEDTQADSSDAAVSTSSADKTADDETEDTASSTTLVKDEDEVYTLVLNYFQALNAKDADAAILCVDTLTDEDKAVVAGDRLIAGYNNVEVYTLPGLEDGSYVIYACYDYMYSGCSGFLPGLTQFYAYITSNGSLRLASEPTEEQQSCMDATREYEDVQSLETSVREKYNEALAADEELAAYVNSITTS